MAMRFALAQVVVLCIVGPLALLVPAAASDYSHTCRSPDGLFVIDDGTLYEAEDYARGDTAGQIPYRATANEKVHAHEQGYCVDWQRSQGQRTTFEIKRYVLAIAFEHRTRQMRGEMRCLLYADGLPASHSCDRRVVTMRIGEPEMDEPGWGIDQRLGESKTITTWTHNGSVVELRTEGETRTFSYLEPRPRLESYGVRRGSLLFDGTSDGRRYAGRSRIFTKACGELSFPVSGPIEAGGARVTLQGKAPKTGVDCRPSGWRDEVLVFELRPGQ